MNAQFSKTRSTEIVESLSSLRQNSNFKTRPTTNRKLAEQAAKIERYARSNYHVLLTGERGTGKTTIARQIHDNSARHNKQFVSLNCATLKEELVEAELFGYEKGAFTGANSAKAGLFETGSGGTVFLDEIAELSLSLQAKLLKAVEEKRIRRVGASGEISIDLRVIAATSRNLREMVTEKQFRHDLYDRLNVLSLHTIPLREQPEQIKELLHAGLEREQLALNRHEKFQIAPEAVQILETYTWAGNFRELQNFVLKLATEYQDASLITAKMIRALLAEKLENTVSDSQMIVEFDAEESLDAIIERVKTRYITHHLQSKSFRQTAAQCGISRSMIRRIACKSTADNIRQTI